MNPAPFEASAAELDDGVRIVSVRGELDLGTAAELEPPLEEAVSAGNSRVLIDLTECEFIDSTGIALIVRTWQRLDRTAEGTGEGRVVICSGNDQVQRVLDVTGLDVSIPVYSSREDALASLRG